MAMNTDKNTISSISDYFLDLDNAMKDNPTKANTITAIPHPL